MISFKNKKKNNAVNFRNVTATLLFAYGNEDLLYLYIHKRKCDLVRKEKIVLLEVTEELIDFRFGEIFQILKSMEWPIFN